MVPWSSSLALSASNPLANVTKPNPFDPRSLNMISTSSKVPYFWKEKKSPGFYESNWIESTQKMQWPELLPTIAHLSQKKISWELVQKSVLCTSRSTSLFFWSKNTDQKFSPRFVLIFGTKATSFEVNVYTSVWLLFKTQGRRKLTLVLKTSVKLVSQVATTTPHH